MKKRILSAVLAGLMLLFTAFALLGCEEKTNDEPIEGLLAIQPIYIGEELSDTNHKFTKDEFTVTAVYTGDRSEEITDYTFELLFMDEGYYVVEFSYGGETNNCYIPCNVDFYPTDRVGYGD